ncbi:hypothetical protein DFJ67_7097 [Asanoa ferruginea]|uniref:YopA central domain-containing protein n=1 Tax=Asanoa ferruginea TaxID=53367 RepID=A0A3D9ZUZ0_9ACTN|nr:hypothetical protein [Asanoa ferruginea]REG01026.1 hypothetical protein DFJ67_7097 [Asanoa ferruginea]GIF47626.1 hypothetical protein Afe04nite_21650 [Asanoa ferruginea]
MPEIGPMNQPEDREPMRPVYPFNEPGSSIALYEGPIVGVAPGPRVGRIELSCRPNNGLRWHIRPEGSDGRVDPRPASLMVQRRGGDWTVEAHRRNLSEGWINMARFSLPDARLRRVIAHWMNLPKISGPIGLTTSDADGRRWWLGRWKTEVDGWILTMDVRPDYAEAMAEAHTTHLYLITHVMEIRRADDGDFDVESVEQLLDCLRVTFSFAFGRWVAPVLPVGYDAIGDVVWEMWTSPICDPAKRIPSAWLFKGRPEDLTELTRKALPAFRDQRRPGFARFQMCMAIQAVESGFVEQRILAAAPALEHLAWANLVSGQRWSRDDYSNRYAEDRLRFLLQEARIPTDIDSVILPALANFARPESLDGPTATTRVRNRLIHPQTPEDQIYRHDGLVQDAWLLSRHYVTLLILHSIGYRGSTVSLVQQTGWEGNAVPVPWADGEAPCPEPRMPPIRRNGRRGNRPS